MVPAEPRKLRCGVIGAGIAGLGAGLALSCAGHDVEMFERSEFKHEVGAAITMTPNASMILDHWGFDQQKAKPTELKQTRVYSWDKLELIARDSFEEITSKYHHRLASYHRVDLHSGLRALAEERSSISIKLGTAVTEVDCDTGTLVFADGSRVQKDLVVVADGIHVSIRLVSIPNNSLTLLSHSQILTSNVPPGRSRTSREPSRRAQ
jgi:salicylate hydroxylase